MRCASVDFTPRAPSTAPRTMAADSTTCRRNALVARAQGESTVPPPATKAHPSRGCPPTSASAGAAPHPRTDLSGRVTSDAPRDLSASGTILARDPWVAHRSTRRGPAGERSASRVPPSDIVDPSLRARIDHRQPDPDAGPVWPASFRPAIALAITAMGGPAERRRIHRRDGAGGSRRRCSSRESTSRRVSGPASIVGDDFRGRAGVLLGPAAAVRPRQHRVLGSSASTGSRATATRTTTI
jgi:hypothetical protein